MSSRRSTAGVTIASSIEFDRIGYTLGDRQILNDISIGASPGQVLCLLGPSGSGKTTLLRLAAGLIKPSSGKIVINKSEVSNSRSVMPPEKRGVGLVFQDFALFPHLTIRKNVEFGLTQLSSAERREHALRMLETVGMAHEAQKYPDALSGGEQQRVALARALAPKPGILLMDEPFSGLDSRLRDTIREDTLRLLRKTRSTVLIVTHDPEEALRIGDKIALLRRGELVQHGDCDDLYNRPNSLFSARFFSELNMLPAKVSDQYAQTAIGGVPVGRGVVSSSNGNVTVCIRPGDVIVQPIKSTRSKAPKPGLSRVYVRYRRFLGEVKQYEVVHAPSDTVLYLRCAPDLIPDEATQIDIALDPAKAMVFETEGEGHLQA